MLRKQKKCDIMKCLLKFSVFLLLLFVLCSSSKAQEFTSVFDELELQRRVNSVDEFFKRFDFETDFKGEKVPIVNDSISVDTILKRNTLISLLNYDTFLNSKNELDSVSSCFINYVMKNNKKIYYTDSTWFAEAFSSFMKNGKVYPLKIYLRTELVKDIIYKWVIFDVQSPFFNCLEDTAHVELSISPGAHGTEFMTLPDIVNLNIKSVRTLFPKKYFTNRLSIFEYLVSTGQIKLSFVTKVVYHFHMDKYDFIVQKFQKRKSYNQGWLINKINSNTFNKL